MKITEYRKNWINAKVAKHAKQLGFVQNDLPTILFTTREIETISYQREKLRGPAHRLTGDGCSSGVLGACWNDQCIIFINIRKIKKLKLKSEDTIVHELIHYRFPGVAHHTKLTQRLYDNLIRLILKEGKTDKEILNAGNVIVEHNNKPPKHRENGTLYYNDPYVKVPKTIKAYHTIDIQKTTLTRSDNSIIPILDAYVISKPDITFFSNRFKTLTNNLKRRIRHELYNDNEDIEIILNYDKTRDYNAMLREDEIKQK